MNIVEEWNRRLQKAAIVELTNNCVPGTCLTFQLCQCGQSLWSCVFWLTVEMPFMKISDTRRGAGRISIYHCFLFLSLFSILSVNGDDNTHMVWGDQIDLVHRTPRKFLMIASYSPEHYILKRNTAKRLSTPLLVRKWRSCHPMGEHHRAIPQSPGYFPLLWCTKTIL